MSARTVVLVHGAWHGAWCWERVVKGLNDADVPSVAVDLPGHGDDQGRRPVDLHGDVAHVREVLDSISGPVVLVGHSYGGAVITGAGVHPGVEHLVYVAAFNLDRGESISSAAAEEAAAAGVDHTGRVNAMDYIAIGDDGNMTVRDEGAPLLFYNDCRPDDVRWAVSRLCPQPAVVLGQEPTEIAWRSKPATYAVCTEDGVMHPDLQRVLARRVEAAVEWPTGHSPFISRPELVTELLVGLATA